MSHHELGREGVIQGLGLGDQAHCGDQTHLGNIDVSSYGGVDSSRNLIRHLATNVAFNQAAPQQQMVSSMQQLQLSHQQVLLPQPQPHLPLQAQLAHQQSPAHLAVHLLQNPDFQQQQPLHLPQPLISSQLMNQQQVAFQAQQAQPNLGTQQQQIQMQCQLQQQQFQLSQQQQHLGIVNNQPQRSLPPSFGVSFLATQPQLVNRHFALLDQELQLQKELTRVTIGIIKGSPDDVQMLEAELTIQKALDCVQKERAGLEVETRELEMAAARRQAEMVKRALMLERELLEIVKQREMAHLARKKENEKERQAQNSGPATISNGTAPRDGGFDGMEAKREGTREEDSIQGMEIVFGEVEKDLVMRKCPRKHILSTTTADQSQDKVEDGRSEATSIPVIVDITNNSTFEVYNSDEDNSQGELYVSHEPVVEEAGFKRDEKSPSPTNGRHEEMEIGLEDVGNGMNNQEVLAQQEEILQQIRRDNEAALRTKELVAKLARNGTDDNSEQVVCKEQADKQVVSDERPIGTDLSEFIVVAVKRRQMKMALKSKGSDSEVQVDKRKSGGGDADSQSGAELEGERKKLGQLAKQRVAAAKVGYLCSK